MTQQATGTIAQIEIKTSQNPNVGQYRRLHMQPGGWMADFQGVSNAYQQGQQVTYTYDTDQQNRKSLNSMQPATQPAQAAGTFQQAAAAVPPNLQSPPAASPTITAPGPTVTGPPPITPVDDSSLSGVLKSAIEAGCIKTPADLGRWASAARAAFRDQPWRPAPEPYANLHNLAPPSAPKIDDPNMPGPADVPVEVYDDPVPF